MTFILPWNFWPCVAVALLWEHSGQANRVVGIKHYAFNMGKAEYLNALIELEGEDYGSSHTRTATGRLSATRPNYSNGPGRDKT